MAMEKNIGLRRMLCLLGLAALLAAGCAHQPGSRVNVDSLLAAIGIDDAGFMHSNLQSGALSANERVPAPAYPDGAPLITLAAREGAVKIVRLLLAAGADPNAVTPVGETPLMLASFFPNEEDESRLRDRYEETARLLLDAGASVNNLPHHYTPLGYAAYRNRQRIMAHLLARGAPVDGDVAGGMTYVNTPLMMAAMQGHYDAAMSLLRAGADPAVRVHQGHTAAELAVKYRHTDLANLLRCAQQQRLAGRGTSTLRC